MRKELIEALVTEAEPKMFPQMLGTADADFYGHQTNHGSFVFGGESGMESTVLDNGTNRTSSLTAPCICRDYEICSEAGRCKDCQNVGRV